MPEAVSAGFRAFGWLEQALGLTLVHMEQLCDDLRESVVLDLLTPSGGPTNVTYKTISRLGQAAPRRIILGLIFSNSRAGEHRQLKGISVGKGWYVNKEAAKP